jgi:hypothetical protein
VLRRIWVLVPLAACDGGDPWEDVGPALPALLRVELGEPVGVTVSAADVGLAVIDVDRCDARPSSTMLGGPWWVVPAAALHLEGGPWCGLSFQFDGPLSLDGTDGLVDVDLTLELGDLELTLTDRLAVDGDVFVLRLGDAGWLDVSDLDRSEDVVIGPGSALHDTLVSSLRRSAGLYRDDDDDGVLTDDELAQGSLTEP